MEQGKMAGIESLQSGLLERTVATLRQHEPTAVAVIATGSYATARATLYSDLDVTVLTALTPDGHYRTWFEAREPFPLHVSAGAASLESWVADTAEPAEWALGFPADEAARFLWAVDAARAALGEPPSTRRPAASPELEDFVECANKVRSAVARGDFLGARWHARDLGGYAPRLLIPLNPERLVTDRRDALQAALDLPIAPPGYQEDLLACLGLLPLDDTALPVAALRLAGAMLAFLRERAPDIDAQPYLSRYLADGTLERHLRS